MQTQPNLHVDASIYKGSFPRFDRPKVVGYIGLENLKFTQYLRDANVQFDLNLHLDKAKRKPLGLDVKLNELLKFLLEHEARLNLPKESMLDKSQFICYRGLMTCVACTPYENREPWKIVAILYKGNIYLCARDTEEKLNRVRNTTEDEKRFTSWGYKFEQYMLSDEPDGKPNPNVPVDETEEFSLVFTTHIGNHKILYGAEMDGIRCDRAPVARPPSTELGPDAIVDYLASKEFIELKTNRHIQFPNQEKSFKRFKTKKWWCQSFLVGIDSILCGFRNDAGIVEELKEYHVRELPKMSRRFWDPNVCINFLESFMTYIKRCLTRVIKRKYGDKALNNLQSLPLISVLCEWRPGMPVKVMENYDHEDDQILPNWYTDNYGKIVKD